jgi:hypothetical protein
MSIVTLKRKSAARTNKSSAISRGLHNQSASMRLSNIRNKQCTSECNVNWVKDYSPENKSQSAYIKYVKGYESSWGGGSTGSNGCLETYMVGTTLKSRGGFTKDVGGLSSSEYTNTKWLQKNCLPTTPSMYQFPSNVTNRCDTVQ